jgi:hypothetical protein
MATIHWSVPIEFVTRVEGRGTELVIHLRSKRISKTALKELLAIYRRYGGDLSELAQFRRSR